MIKAKTYPDFKEFVKGFIANVKAGKRYDFRTYQEAVLPLTYSSPWPESDIAEVTTFTYSPKYVVPYSDELLYSVGAQMRTADFFMDLQYAIINGYEVDTVYCEWLARVKPYSMLNAKVNKPAPVTPTFTTQPVGGAFSVGSPITLTVAVDNAISLQWFKDEIEISGETGTTLSIASPTVEDSGTYFCRATGSGSTSADSNDAVIEVYELPVITTQPQATVNVTEGDSLDISVVATNATGYQWFKDGSAISGKTTERMNISPANVSDSGAYYCEVSGAHNSKVTSHESVVTVAPM